MQLFAHEVNFDLSYSTAIQTLLAPRLLLLDAHLFLMMQSLVLPRQYLMVSSSKTQGVCVFFFFYPQHLTQTAEPTHAALSVGKG